MHNPTHTYSHPAQIPGTITGATRCLSDTSFDFCYLSTSILTWEEKIVPRMKLGGEESTISLHMNQTPVEALRMVLTPHSLPVTKLCSAKKIQKSKCPGQQGAVIVTLL